MFSNRHQMAYVVLASHGTVSDVDPCARPIAFYRTEGPNHLQCLISRRLEGKVDIY